MIIFDLYSKFCNLVLSFKFPHKHLTSSEICSQDDAAEVPEPKAPEPELPPTELFQTLGEGGSSVLAKGF